MPKPAVVDRNQIINAKSKLVESAENVVSALKGHYYSFLALQIKQMNETGCGVEETKVIFNNIAGEAAFVERSDLVRLATLAEELLEKAPKKRRLEVLGVCKSAMTFAASQNEELGGKEMELLLFQFADLYEHL